jgi:hypothetical protein
LQVSSHEGTKARRKTKNFTTEVTEYEIIYKVVDKKDKVYYYLDEKMLTKVPWHKDE